MPRYLANILLLITGAIWGLGFVAQSTAMDSISPIYFTGVRFGFAALALLPFFIWEHRRAKARAGGNLPESINWHGFVLLGVLLFAALLTQQIGLLTTSVTNSGFITGVYVVLVPVLGAVFLRQYPHFIIWPAATLTITGLFLLSGGRFIGLTQGDLWTLACALFWAMHVLALGIIVRQAERPFALAFTQFAVCSAMGLLIAPLFETVSTAAIYAALPEVLFTGVISGGLAFTIQALAQRHTTAAQAAIFLASEALFAATFGAFFLGERIPAVGYVGCAFIFAAILLVELVPAMRKNRSQHA